MEQNQRLTSDLRDVEERENNLKQEIQRLQLQFNQRRTRMQAHFDQVESVSLLLEREELTCSLEYSSQTIQDLERRQREQEALIRLSLQSELDMSGTESEKSLRKQFEAINELEEYEFDGDDNQQFQDEGSCVYTLSEEILSAYSQLKNMCILIREREKDRIPAVYSESLEHSSHSDTVQSLQIGQLKCIVIEIKSLLHDILRMESKDVCSACTGEDVRLRLEQELHSAELQVECKTRELQVSETTQRTQRGELLDLRSKLTLLEARLKAVNEEREALKSDLINLTQTREQIILRSWETRSFEMRIYKCGKLKHVSSNLYKYNKASDQWERDEAVNRKNAAELEVVKARTDLAQASEQLLEAVQQKVQIAEQLEQWESDIHTVIESRLEESKMSSAKHCHSSVQRTLSKHTNNKLVGLFQRS
ncbi:bicaudal D-related protein homolog [Eurytemora carolleeae]|uniref:bicaudal D-related protein homolog n=1 Tax=Eurytemora carolleeae TaxID=1294199 RepID=UPI000C78A8F8|nr:bicaudal D-related protein homolog [Eurytemora carolleeae]|eukprot:XP_023343908.1 bicaudal D-related protein homolog [Eurytemora affinis]